MKKIILFFAVFTLMIAIYYYVDKNYSIIKNNDENNASEVSSKELYEKIIELNDNNQVDEAAILISDVFNAPLIKDRNQIRGYIVACYYGLGRYEKAINEILLRYHNDNIDDFNLLWDLFLCLKNLSRHKSLAQSVNLARKIKEEHEHVPVSVFFPFFSNKSFRSLLKGKHASYEIHSLDQSLKKSIEGLIEKYPDDKFIDFALYLLGRFDRAIEVNSNSRIKNVILYAKGYEIIRSIYLAKNDFRYYSDFLSLKARKDADIKLQLNQAIYFLKIYFENYSKDIHSDDAAYWIAWSYANLFNYKKSLEWLNILKSYKDSDYFYRSFDFEEKVIREADISIAIEQLDVIGAFRNTQNYYAQRLVRTIMLRIKEFDILVDNIAKLEHDEKKQIIIEYSKAKLLASDVNEAKKAYKYYARIYKDGLPFEAKFAEEIARYEDVINLASKIQSDNSLKSYIKLSIKLRRSWDFEASLYLLDEAIDKYGEDSNEGYLLYLKYLVYKRYYPEGIERLIENFLIKFPHSSYADDMLAELAYTHLVQFNRLEEGENVIYKRLINTYNNCNACDNALDYLAYSYLKNRKMDKLLLLDKKIVSNYPYTRFARKAFVRLNSQGYYKNNNEERIKLEAQLLKNDRLVTEREYEYYIIISSFDNYQDANVFLSRIKHDDQIKPKIVSANNRFRVAIGSYNNFDDANIELKRIRKMNYKDAWIFFY